MGKQAVVETVVVDVEAAAAVEEEAVEVAAGVEAVAASKPPYFQIRRRGE